MLKSIEYKNKNKRILGISAVAAALLLTAGVAAAAPSGETWPYRFEADGADVTVYEPHIESYAKKVVTARSAFALRSPGEAPAFGAVRFTAIVVEKNGRARFSSIAIQHIKYPKGEDHPGMTGKVEQALEKAQLTMPLARFRENRDGPGSRNSDDGYRNTPPRIYYEESPAVLVTIDGDPILKEVEGGYYKYVVNTAYFIVLNPDDNAFYLKGGRWWYRARDLNGDWRSVRNPPGPIAALAKKAFTGDADDKDSTLPELAAPPKIIVSTEPAELIVVDGKPKLVSIVGTSLLYVDNTEDDVLLDIRTQQYYVLISGRWYTAKTLDGGDWQHIRADRLPNDFARIPEDSGVASVRASVAGTPEAEAAVLDTVIPQTAEIDRATATAEVLYDGVPKFRRIRGTAVYYALNANKSVLRIRGRYYVVDGGVWFEAADAEGPWAAAVAVPPEVYDIPPSEPVYHVRYVHIYDYTPSIVYVGYTPGYTSAYVYHGTVIYGTGYYYDPWYDTYYFPHPVTFGFGVHYHPYIGWWGYPVGFSYGWIAFGWFPFPCAYWGPGGYIYGYRHGYYHHHHHDYYHGYRNGYRHGYAAGRSAGYSAVGRTARPRDGNIYSYRSNGVHKTRTRVADLDRPAAVRPGSAASLTGRRVYGPRGDIHRQRPAVERLRQSDRRRPAGERFHRSEHQKRPTVSRQPEPSGFKTRSPAVRQPARRPEIKTGWRSPERAKSRPAPVKSAGTRSQRAPRPVLRSPKAERRSAPARQYTPKPQPKDSKENSSRKKKSYSDSKPKQRFNSGAHSKPRVRSAPSRASGSRTRNKSAPRRTTPRRRR